MAPAMITDLAQAMGVKESEKGKFIHFYKCNIASKEEVERVWKEIV